ncbi:Cilia- and flagella-associated protein 73 [Coelomomyces lativittatus]|nr:Cilia- and flagella-associated protein 73 [Coelomomyces lativittatus]KAJ1506206.1 Cilia- and flagella-associated protein 73 [Coelomomyces lativittatus]
MNSNEGNLSEFFKKTVENSLQGCISYLEDDPITPVTRLLEKKYEIQDTENELENQKSVFNYRMEALGERRKILKKSKEKLNDDIIKLGQYLKENDVKCTRAIKKAVGERKSIEIKDKEIYQLRKLISQLNDAKSLQDESLKKGQAYQHFLESVLEFSDGFPDLNDLIIRFEALQATKDELKSRSKLVQDLYEKEQMKFQAWIEEKKNHLLQQNNTISQLTEKLDILKHQSEYWLMKIEASVSSAAKKSLEVGQIQTATNNLFHLVKSHRQQRISHTSSSLLQLEKVQKFILDLTEILSSGLLTN